jgi:hypothetical protein
LPFPLANQEESKMDRNDRNDRNAKEGFGDGQGTRVGAPDQEQASPGQHSDTPTDRPQRTTGAGDEMQANRPNPVEQHKDEHQSGYGGQGGAPKTSSDDRSSQR